MRNIWTGRKRMPLNVRYAVSAIVLAAAAATVICGLNITAASDISGKERMLEDELYRKAALCYSVEGAYPQSLSYLEENYGVVIDREKYVVYYSCFASNIPPEIIVVYSGA